MQSTTLAVVGNGILASHALYILSHGTGYQKIVIAARNTERATRQANTLRQHAINMGRDVNIEVKKIDLDCLDQTAETLSKVAADVIFNTASMQSWWVVTKLPEHLRDMVAETRFGPWLPLHLSPTLKLMEAVKAAKTKSVVVNAAFPDAVNPVLETLGLAPAIGIGNIANVVPALRLAVADKLKICVRDVDVRLCGHHFVSYRLSRLGSSDGAPVIFHASVNGSDVTHLLDQDAIFQTLIKGHRRTGGIEGQPVTASSAVSVLEALLSPQKTLVHAPGPNGLPGGYPVWLSRTDQTISLPRAISLEDAVRVNEDGQVHDGIQCIDSDGTVHFTQAQSAEMNRLFGYNCTKLPVSDAHDAASELSKRYDAFLQHNQLIH